MPVMSCEKDGKKGYKYGESGRCYTYSDEASRKSAKRKAILQGTAVAQSTGEKLKLSKEDLSDIEDKETKFEPMIKDDSNHCLFGWAYVAKDLDNKQIVDHSEEFVKEEDFEDLELATYLFNIAFRQSDIRHSCIAKGLLIDSMVFTKEKVEAMRKSKLLKGDIALGVWMGFWFPEDEDWDEIQKMDAPMFSLYGSAIKELIEDEEVEE